MQLSPIVKDWGLLVLTIVSLLIAAAGFLMIIWTLGVWFLIGVILLLAGGLSFIWAFEHSG